MTEDRRQRKSRTALKQAMEQLMRTKSAQRISVAELCRLADVNRSTFYAHYLSVGHLLCDMHEALFADMDRFLGLDEGSGQGTFQRTSAERLTGVLEYMSGDRFRFFLENNPDHLLEQNLIRHYTERYCRPDTTLEQRYAQFYHTAGCFSLVQRWIGEGCPCPAEELARQLYQLSATGELYL